MVVDLKGDDNVQLIDTLKSKDFVINPDKLELIIENADLKTAVPAIESNAEPDIRIYKVIKRLSQHGRDDHGHEALGRFLNYLINANKINDRNEKDFIKSLIEKYNMMTSINQYSQPSTLESIPASHVSEQTFKGMYKRVKDSYSRYQGGQIDILDVWESDGKMSDLLATLESNPKDYDLNISKTTGIQDLATDLRAEISNLKRARRRNEATDDYFKNIDKFYREVMALTANIYRLGS